MHVNLLRTGVGVDSIEHLAEIQETYRYAIDENGDDIAFFTTRNMPQRSNELLNGGSVYWIIKRLICVRQIITDIQQTTDDEGQRLCIISMKPQIMMVDPIPHKHIQGWRYLSPDKAPKDIRPYDKNTNTDKLDPQMEKELRELGLL